MSNWTLMLSLCAVRLFFKDNCDSWDFLFIILIRLISYSHDWPPRCHANARNHIAHHCTTMILCESTRTWTLDDYVKNGMYYFLHRLIQMVVLPGLTIVTMKYLIKLLRSVAPLFWCILICTIICGPQKMTSDK